MIPVINATLLFIFSPSHFLNFSYTNRWLVLCFVQNLPSELYKPLKDLQNVTLVFEATYDLLSHASAAIVTSGTATLETALFKVPQVVVYKAGNLEYAVASKVVKVDYISLVNLIAGKEVVKELIQQDATVEACDKRS